MTQSNNAFDFERIDASLYGSLTTTLQCLNWTNFVLDLMRYLRQKSDGQWTGPEMQAISFLRSMINDQNDTAWRLAFQAVQEFREPR